MSDRVVVLNHGRIEQLGTPRDIYEQPASRFTADFVGVTNVVAGIVVERNGSGTRLETASGSISLHGDYTAGDEVQLAVRPEKLRFVDVGAADSLQAIVEGARYLGDVTHWRVRLVDGTRWTVLAQNDGAERALAPGSAVGLAWDRRHGVRLG
jgi:ABC-type Fe3+/spermidine/putrescine transport system ATPase subunit